MELKPKGFLRINELEQYLNMGRSTIWARAKNEDDPFPKPIKLSPRVTVWNLEDISNFVDGLTEKEAN
jgi:prophage regulatory protein